MSSVTTSNCSESVSGYSTPFTSNAATPADSNRQSKIEVVIPVVKTRDSAAKAMQKAKDYMMGNDTKNKRQITEIADSEDDDLSDPSPIARRTRNDEQVARKLQEDLDREAAEAFVSEEAYEESVDQDLMDENSDDLATLDPKGKGKGKSTAPRSRGRAAAKLAISDSDDEEEEFSDSIDFEPPTKKRKTTVMKGKGKGKAKTQAKRRPDVLRAQLKHKNLAKTNIPVHPPSPGFDDDEDEDIPRKWLDLLS